MTTWQRVNPFSAGEESLPIITGNVGSTAVVAEILAALELQDILVDETTTSGATVIDGYLHRPGDGIYNVVAFGADPTGVSDSSSAITNALSTAGTDGTVFFPKGTFLANNITLPNAQRQTLLGSEGAIIKKNANGPVFTTPSSGWGLNLEFRNIAIDGNGANFTGTGITVGLSSTYFKFEGGRITDTTSNCISYSDGGVSGELGTIANCELTIYQGQSAETNQNVAAIRLPSDSGSGNRNIVNVRTDANMLVDDYGSENSHIVACVARNIILSNAPATYPHKMTLTSCRLATLGVDVAIRGTQNSFVGNVLAGSLALEASAANGVYTGNIVAGDVTAAAGTTNNVIYGNRPSSGTVTDSGANIFIRAGHVAGATPTGGASGDIKVGTGKIWVNDAGTWKSAAIA